MQFNNQVSITEPFVLPKGSYRYYETSKVFQKNSKFFLTLQYEANSKMYGKEEGAAFEKPMKNATGGNMYKKYKADGVKTNHILHIMPEFDLTIIGNSEQEVRTIAMAIANAYYKSKDNCFVQTRVTKRVYSESPYILDRALIETLSKPPFTEENIKNLKNALNNGWRVNSWEIELVDKTTRATEPIASSFKIKDLLNGTNAAAPAAPAAPTAPLMAAEEDTLPF